MRLTSTQQEKYDHLKLDMLSANSKQEVDHISKKIQDFLDTIGNGTFLSDKIHENERKSLQDLKQKMLDATDEEEVFYYEKKIHEILDNEKR